MRLIQKNILRGIAWLVAFCGFLLYGFLLYIWNVEWQQNQIIHESLLTEIFFIVDDAIFVSGLPPILLVIYFLVLGKTIKDWGLGLLFVFVSIPVHYYIAGIAAHTEPVVYIPFQLGELAVVIGLMLYWHRKYRTMR